MNMLKWMSTLSRPFAFAATGVLLAACAGTGAEMRGTGDLGIVVERATGSVLVVDHSEQKPLGRIEGLGDLSHASAVYSRDARYAYIFGRDGGLTKIDVLTRKIVKRVVQGGNSIGGAISQDGKLVAVSNYKPGGVKVFNSQTLDLVANLPATGVNGVASKTVGLVDAPGQRFVYSLYDANEIWIADLTNPASPRVQKFTDAGDKPYDALMSDDGRHYIAGLFGEDGLSLVDLWNPDKGVRRILDGYGRGEKQLPVYKMPHLEGWAIAGDLAFLPAIGHHEVLVVDRRDWKEVGRIPVHGQPVFAMAQPDGRQIWVNFALPHNDTVQVIDVQSLKIIKTLKPGKGVLHMEFTPRGEKVWMSVRDRDLVQIYDTITYEKVGEFPAIKPSGIFFTSRAHKIGL
ncbi:MAG: protein nirF [Rhodospirillales bacterium]|nr:protein nirF [Rhodospirillales bacterium]MCW9001937.1 protein nirF [Rhodospirillales bacterium]